MPPRDTLAIRPLIFQSTLVSNGVLQRKNPLRSSGAQMSAKSRRKAVYRAPEGGDDKKKATEKPMDIVPGYQPRTTAESSGVGSGGDYGGDDVPMTGSGGADDPMTGSGGADPSGGKSEKTAPGVRSRFPPVGESKRKLNIELEKIQRADPEYQKMSRRFGHQYRRQASARQIQKLTESPQQVEQQPQTQRDPSLAEKKEKEPVAATRRASESSVSSVEEKQRQDIKQHSEAARTEGYEIGRLGISGDFLPADVHGQDITRPYLEGWTQGRLTLLKEKASKRSQPFHKKSKSIKEQYLTAQLESQKGQMKMKSKALESKIAETKAQYEQDRKALQEQHQQELESIQARAQAAWSQYQQQLETKTTGDKEALRQQYQQELNTTVAREREAASQQYEQMSKALQERIHLEKAQLQTREAVITAKENEIQSYLEQLNTQRETLRKQEEEMRQKEETSLQQITQRQRQLSEQNRILEEQQSQLETKLKDKNITEKDLEALKAKLQATQSAVTSTELEFETLQSKKNDLEKQYNTRRLSVELAFKENEDKMSHGKDKLLQLQQMERQIAAEIKAEKGELEKVIRQKSTEEQQIVAQAAKAKEQLRIDETKRKEIQDQIQKAKLEHDIEREKILQEILGRTQEKEKLDAEIANVSGQLTRLNANKTLIDNQIALRQIDLQKEISRLNEFRKASKFASAELAQTTGVAQMQLQRYHNNINDARKELEQALARKETYEREQKDLQNQLANLTKVIGDTRIAKEYPVVRSKVKRLPPPPPAPMPKTSEEEPEYFMPEYKPTVVTHDAPTTVSDEPERFAPHYIESPEMEVDSEPAVVSTSTGTATSVPDFSRVRRVLLDDDESRTDAEAIRDGRCALRGECENQLAQISTKDLAAIWKGIGGEPPAKSEVPKGELRQWYCDKVNRINEGSQEERELRAQYCEALYARLHHKMVASIEQFPDPYYTSSGATKSSKEYAQEVAQLLESRAKMPRPNLIGPGCDAHITKDGLIKLTSYQEFVRNYFRPESPVKGLLLWHSTGSGKTCSLLAATSATWEVDPKPWSIVLSASSSIITGFVKNVFDMVCHSGMQQHLLAEAKRKGRSEVDIAKYKSMSTSEKARTFAQLFGGCKGWVTEKTQSFPQLQAWKHSRLKTFLMGQAYGQADWAEIQRCRKKNEAENGPQGDPKDPLRRCLVIIDEVHSFIDSQFYSASGQFLEKDWDQMMRVIQRSYSSSGENSVRFLVLSATPQKSHPANLFRIINMLSERPSLPVTDSAYEAWVQDFESEAADPLLPENIAASDLRQCSAGDHACQYMNAWYSVGGPDVRWGDRYPSKAFHFFSAARGVISYVDVSHDPSRVPHVTRTRNVFVRVSNRQVKAIQTCLDKWGGKMASKKKDRSRGEFQARKWYDDDDNDDEYDDIADYLASRRQNRNKKKTKTKTEDSATSKASMGKCLRARATFAEDSASYFFDSSSFNADRLLAEMRYLSPVISQLLIQVMKYDEDDMRKYGYVYRHIIYAPDPVTLRLTLSCFIAADFAHLVFNKGEQLGFRSQSPSPFWGVAAISTEATFWRHKMNSAFIDAVRNVFNDLKGNENGERLRILLIDSTMSEGVDLKPAHFHFIEPTKSDAMLKRLAPSLKNKVFEDTEYAQVIGRATRLCGGSGGLKGIRWFEEPHTIDGRPVPYDGSGVSCGMSKSGEWQGGKCMPKGWVVTVDRYYPVFDRETQRTFQARMPLELELNEGAINANMLRHLGAQEMIKNLAIMSAADRVLNRVQEDMAAQDRPDEIDLYTGGTSSADMGELPEAEDEPDKEVRDTRKRMAARGEEFIEGYHTRRVL